MKIVLSLFLAAISLPAFAQMDTIYTNNDKIPCLISEVTPDAVKFKYAGEDVINSVYKNTIQKIVFKSGRVQQFAEATSYKTVKGAEDYDNVSLTQVESEVRGLFKLGDVSAKAKGTTTLSSMTKVKERAIQKTKIQAAMMGANIVYLTQNTTTGNVMGTKYESGRPTETNMEGVAYSNKLPNYDEFKELVDHRTVFSVYERARLGGSDFDMAVSDMDKTLEVSKIYNESGLIMIEGRIKGVDSEKFRVVSFSHKKFIIVYKDGASIYNFKVRVE